MSMPAYPQNQTVDPVSPLDTVNGNGGSQSVVLADSAEEGTTSGIGRSARTGSSSSGSSTSSQKIARTARFAEATSVNSPVSAPIEHRSPFADPPSPPSMAASQAQPSDVGFGYISNEPVEQHAALQPNVNGPSSPPLKSALKTPGTQPRMLNPLSPTFREEQLLEKQEEDTEREQAKDLVRFCLDCHLCASYC